MTLPLAHPDASRVRIAETFVSVQGEGKLTGVPSWFCRSSGCNLRCTWCDTPYASWNPEGPTRTLDDLIAEAMSHHASSGGGGSGGVRHAVLTGGEPMLFDAMAALGRELASRGIHVTFETAATIFRPPSDTGCSLMSMSPKLSNSTPRGSGGSPDPRDPTGAWAARHEANRLNIPIIQQLIDAYPDRQLKFVVAQNSERADLAEIDALLAQLTNFAPSDIMLMPEGVKPPTPEHKAWVLSACLSRGWRYCNRLHIELFGNVRGT